MRSGVPNVAILITDGPSSTGSPSTSAAATAAHQAGIKIYTIGVSSVDRSEVQLISSPPRLYNYQWWTVSNFGSLSSLLPVVTDSACKPEYG